MKFSASKKFLSTKISLMPFNSIVEVAFGFHRRRVGVGRGLNKISVPMSEFFKAPKKILRNRF